MTGRETREFLLRAYILNPASAPILRKGLWDGIFLESDLNDVWHTLRQYEREYAIIPSPAILQEILAAKPNADAVKIGGLLQTLTLWPLGEGGIEAIPHIAYHLGRANEAWRTDKLQKTMIKAATGIQGGMDSEEALQLMWQDLPRPLGSFAEGNLIDSLAEVSASLTDRRLNPNKYPSVPFGFPLMDEATSGLYPGELAVILGGTGMGKSTLLGQIAINAAMAGKRVLLVTIENPLRSYQYRLYSNLSGVPFKRFKTATLSDEDKERWLGAMAGLPESFCLKIIHFTQGCSTADIGAYLASHDAYDFLVVDQITNMRPADGVMRAKMVPFDWRWIALIAQDMRVLASSAYRGRGIPLLSATQARGGTAGKALTTDDAAMAKAILHEAHAAPFLQKEETTGSYVIGMAKWRDSYFPMFPVFPQFECFRILSDPQGFHNSGSPLDMGSPSMDSRVGGYSQESTFKTMAGRDADGDLESGIWFPPVNKPWPGESGIDGGQGDLLSSPSVDPIGTMPSLDAIRAPSPPSAPMRADSEDALRREKEAKELEDLLGEGGESGGGNNDKPYRGY
jgi:hypothetical protein